MTTEETALLKRIRIKTNKKMNNLFVGEYHSAFKGFGLNFESVREYQYGDDVRAIDWNVSARMNHLYIKEYSEERELSVVLMVDLSGSTEFGTGRSKRDIIMETVTLLLYLAQMNNDRITVVLFTDTVEKFLRPRKGKKFVLTVLDEILKFRPAGRGTGIGGAIDFVLRVMKKRSVVFLISDFIDEGYDIRLRRLRRRHDLIPVVVTDPVEKGLPLFGLAEFIDLETGKVFLSDTLPEKRKGPLFQEFDAITLSTEEPIETAILRFFEKRNRSKLTKSSGAM
ncbi:MAG TPA: DUF58 domain-containing protein [Spirochaetota bacterium]|mgnify:CR=1 FL=1|nr:DUF58 domain-containing protein [Spirochaetota bacterium]HQO01130.1 DUF58 domain-containing protein [Spirochaetota bacterium]HQP48742.1 DUF58 domain-containing protein [Spirochaetota bacterium]